MAFWDEARAGVVGRLAAPGPLPGAPTLGPYPVWSRWWGWKGDRWAAAPLDAPAQWA